jgi:hypothetical protein
VSGITFGDDEPEDAWDADDTIPEQIANLTRRFELLIHGRVRLTGDSVEDQLDQLAALVRKARRKRLLGRERLRATQVDEDLAYVRSRL